MPLAMTRQYKLIGPPPPGPWFAYDGTNDSANQDIITSINYSPYGLSLLDTDVVFFGALDFGQSPARYVGHVLTISGNTVTAGAAQNLSAAGTSATNNSTCIAVDSDTLLLMDRSGTTMRAQTVTRSGNTLTPNGSPTTIGSPNAFFPFIVPYGNSQNGDGGDYHFSYRIGSSTLSSEVRNVSGTTIGAFKAAGSNGGGTSQTNIWGGGNGLNHQQSGGSIGGERIAWYGGNGAAPDRLQFSTFDGASTITAGTSYDTVTNLPSTGSFGLSRVIDDDTVQAFFYDGSDTRVRTLSLTANNVTATNTSNLVAAGERYGASSFVNPIDSEVVICAQENIVPANTDVRVIVIDWSDVNTPSIATPVVLDSLASSASPFMVRLDANRHLAVWGDITNSKIVARVMNRV